MLSSVARYTEQYSQHRCTEVSRVNIYSIVGALQSNVCHHFHTTQKNAPSIAVIQDRMLSASLRHTVIFQHRCIKGTVAWDFYPLVLFINRSHLGPFYFTKLFSNSVSNSPSYSNLKFILRYVPLRVTKFFCRYQGFKTCVTKALPNTVHILVHTLFSLTVPLKDMASFLKKLFSSALW